ncbi:MAG: hypothetical protein ABF461_02650 [Zymomonas mobilis subsp. pomaceae]|uniref:Preprotein translocase subunit SecD n=1 Tax=Zymomonas mobilis subsp. pomaceae (strain ATCC 29192 / DSM 22645 / JCM 10191 / CCUG 17912 / NBRC 13757 / NCIMB 11200 / NRRL B-4491 / Barker I) TaxID=579138 RepID=F8EU41_ZYMMT|nr:hypothetical protein [Zymomonas mobilis]AEI37121.1 hypothetical protein Zymop_0218 [Zymomonas mobilis subsp. pomaceae ATCC 29192]MDX5948492.1 hypothetical protein [Zymomonas mobilis subsp. pomaceae]GEB89443.1 hypothetical protein ZMO02_10800 [Zymomonas mobilis subsp. pomaceae]
MILSSLLLLSAPPVASQAVPIPMEENSHPTQKSRRDDGFYIGEVKIDPTEIIDARALPQLKGNPVIMLTLTGEGTEKLTDATAGNGFSQMIEIRFKGKMLSQLVLGSPISDNVLTFSVPLTYQQAQSIAADIAQKKPLPESTD